ncbi:hypothetical protein SAMN05444320_110124 [Streptoalloteichus hindustanus]|uniref:Uncharacterized protein n=1 Tax=Streptoalloteichus hindustanus TaxID=2017 RepID=A0A1M5L0H8_STRHI|nr:hypothetical protein SAMN05444320_110124 [Streptoalloteichus hindustanus]
MRTKTDSTAVHTQAQRDMNEFLPVENERDARSSHGAIRPNRLRYLRAAR